MDTDPQQDRLRALFSELRQSDERRTPRFQDDWDAAMARRNQPSTIAWGRLAAAIVLLALGVTAAVTLRSKSHHQDIVRKLPDRAPVATPVAKPVEWAVADSISEWQSPTAFLLAAPTDTAWPDSTDDGVDETAPAHSDPRHL